MINIKERIEEIEKRTKSVSILTHTVSEFLTETVEIKPLIICPGFYLDSLYLYEQAISNIKDGMKILAVIQTLVIYIANTFGVCGYDKERMEVLLGGDEIEEGFIGGVSISKFVGKNAAQCMERASFLHNCLKILGCNSTLVNGKFKCGNINGPHSYNLLITKKGTHWLIDPTNYVKLSNNDSRVAIFKITEEEYNGLINGNTTYSPTCQRFFIKNTQIKLNWMYS